MNTEIMCTNDLLAVNELPLRESDFIECQKALFGKKLAFFYAVIEVCCVAVLGVYAIAKQMETDTLPVGTMLVPFICLLIASIFYFPFPKWLGKLRYRQYETSNNKPRSVAFYTDHFEVLVDDAKVGSYSYASVRRIVQSENLAIVMLPNMVCLPVRRVGISDECWQVIEQYIAIAMNT